MGRKVPAMGEQAENEGSGRPDGGGVTELSEFDGADGHRYRLDGEQWMRLRKVDAHTKVEETLGASESIPMLADVPPIAPEKIDAHTRVSPEMSV